MRIEQVGEGRHARKLPAVRGGWSWRTGREGGVQGAKRWRRVQAGVREEAGGQEGWRATAWSRRGVEQAWCGAGVVWSRK